MLALRVWDICPPRLWLNVLHVSLQKGFASDRLVGEPLEVSTALQMWGPRKGCSSQGTRGRGGAEMESGDGAQRRSQGWSAEMGSNDGMRRWGLVMAELLLWPQNDGPM